MGGQDVVRAEDFLHGGLHTVEGLGAGVGVVGDGHGRHLAVGHAVHAGIGDHIQVDVPVLEQERVVSGLLDAFEALFNGEEGEFLDDTHLVHLERDLVLRLVEFDGHIR